MKKFQKFELKTSSKKNKHSVYDFFKNNWQIFLILFASAIILSIYTFLKYHLPIWDEGVYLGMSKFLFSWSKQGLWEIFRPILLPFLIGLGWKAGLDALVFGQILSILFSLGCIFLVYLIGLNLFNKRIAILSAIVFALTPSFFKYSEYILTDIPSLFFILLAVYFILKNRFFLAGLFSGLAFLTKFPQLIFLIAVFLFFIFEIIFNQLNKQKNKHLTNKRRTNKQKINEHTPTFSFISSIKKYIRKPFVFFLAILLVVLPYFLFNFIFYYPNTTKNIYEATLWPVVAATSFQNNPYQNLIYGGIFTSLQNFFYYPLTAIFDKHWGFLFYLLFFVFLYLLFKEKQLKWQLFKDRKHIFILFYLLVYFIYYSSIPYKQDRFIVFFAPLIVIYCSYAFFRIWDYLINSNKRNNLAKSTNIAKANKVKRFYHVLLMGLFILFVVFSFFAVLSKDAKFFAWKSSAEPEVVTKYYRYFENNGVQGMISTGDPVLAAYTDNRIVGLGELSAFFNGYTEDWNITSAFFADYSYPCLVDDSDCQAKRNYLVNNLKQDFDLVLEGKCYDSNCYVFIKK